jgi:ankyrin repeat protein
MAARGLLDPGAQLSVTGPDVGTPEARLFTATEKGDLNEIRALLETDSQVLDVNRPVMTQHGPMTSLMEAAKAHDVRVLQLLLNAGARTEIQEVFGGTAFHFACGRGTEANVQTLVDAGCDTEARDVEGRTGLMVATIGGRPDVLEVLVEAGVALDTRNGSGWTAFHWACFKGQSWHADCVEVLVEAGCDQQAKTTDNLTGQMLATVRALLLRLRAACCVLRAVLVCPNGRLLRTAPRPGTIGGGERLKPCGWWES